MPEDWAHPTWEVFVEFGPFGLNTQFFASKAIGKNKIKKPVINVKQQSGSLSIPPAEEKSIDFKSKSRETIKANMLEEKTSSEIGAIRSEVSEIGRNFEKDSTLIRQKTRISVLKTLLKYTKDETKIEQYLKELESLLEEMSTPPPPLPKKAKTDTPSF